MTLLVGIFSFLAGFSLAIACAYRVWRRQEEANAADPLLNPPNEHAQRLFRAVRTQLRLWEHYGYQLDERSPEDIREVLQLLRQDGVLTVYNGVMTLPNGGKIQIARLARELDVLLVDSYKALDEAAAIILDYEETLPRHTLDADPGQVLYSKKFAYEHEIVRLAQMLGLNPDKNEMARFGGAALWQRWSARLFPL